MLYVFAICIIQISDIVRNFTKLSCYIFASYLNLCSLFFKVFGHLFVHDLKWNEKINSNKKNTHAAFFKEKRIIWKTGVHSSDGFLRVTSRFMKRFVLR